jgi:hypothetical protein
MDLKYEGQYRMMEISKFHFLRDANDIMLLPTVVEKMN